MINRAFQAKLSVKSALVYHFAAKNIFRRFITILTHIFLFCDVPNVLHLHAVVALSAQFINEFCEAFAMQTKIVVFKLIGMVL